MMLILDHSLVIIQERGPFMRICCHKQVQNVMNSLGNLDPQHKSYFGYMDIRHNTPIAPLGIFRGTSFSTSATFRFLSQGT